jgi:hypothetical protein
MEHAPLDSELETWSWFKTTMPSFFLETWIQSNGWMLRKRPFCVAQYKYMMDFHMVFSASFQFPLTRHKRTPLLGSTWPNHWSNFTYPVCKFHHSHSSSLDGLTTFVFWTVLGTCHCACFAAQLACPKFLNEIGLFLHCVEEFGRAKIFDWAVHGQNGLYLAPS